LRSGSLPATDCHRHTGNGEILAIAVRFVTLAFGPSYVGVLVGRVGHVISDGVAGTVIYFSADTLKENTAYGEEIYYRVHVLPMNSKVTTTISKKLIAPTESERWQN
jgi:uncharacterized membrane protein